MGNLRAGMEVVFVIVLVVAGLIAGCSDPDYIESTNRKRTSACYINTIEYDGHKFIWAEGVNGGNLVHHPDCPCVK